MPSPPLSLVQSLSPRIAVLTSDDVVDSCEANGCRGLEELLRPWESGAEMVQIMSSTLTPTKHPTFPLRFVSYGSIFPHPDSSSPNPEVVVDLISSLVGKKEPDEEQQYPITRSLLLSSKPVSPHETFNHPVGMLLAISTSTPDPLGTLQRLQGRALGPMSQVVPWMDGINVLRFYLVVHDVSKMGENLEAAYDLLAGVKKGYGPHSALLVINSQVPSRTVEPQETPLHPSIPLPKTPVPSISDTYAAAMSSISLSPALAMSDNMAEAGPSTKVYASRLTSEDTSRLVALVKEVVTQSLVPWMEARVREWNEIWHNNRRGITGRLFGAGRKLFSSRPASPSPNAQGYNPTKGYYPVTSVEALSRRLADFAFMLRDYRFASTVYDSLRRDFAQDRAWRYAAASTEMYGLSLLLSHTYFHPSTPPKQPSSPFTTLQHTDISSWLEQAVLAYQGRAPANQIQLDALRITILYYEAWKMIGEWRGVGGALVRAAGEAEEVPSAVMIEEAAAADTKKAQRGLRRRAFHLVLAAQRYEKTGLKKYSRRCLEKASEIYRSAPWSAAQDVIEYSLGRQAYTLGESDVAVEHFLRLLGRRDSNSQAGVLEDLGLAYEALQSHSGQSTTAELPAPIFEVNAARIVLSQPSTSRMGPLEQQLLDLGRKVRPRDHLEASVGETFEVHLVVRNPLNAQLTLSDIKLNTSELLHIPEITDIDLSPYEARTVIFPVTATQPSTISITSISFMFHRFFPCTQPLGKRGKRLFGTKQQRLTPTYAKDTSLTIEIGASRPRIRALLKGVPDQLYHGETVSCNFIIENTGSLPVESLEMFINEPGMITTTDTPHTDTTASISNCIKKYQPITLYKNTLAPGETTTVPVQFTALRTGQVEILGLVLHGEECTPFELETEILPLLDLQSRPLPALNPALVLEISNAADSLVEIDRIQGISLTSSISPIDPAERVLPNQTFITTLEPQTTSETPDLTQASLVQSLSALVQGQEPSQSVHPPSVSVGDASPTYLSSRQRYRLDFLRSHFPSIPPSVLEASFPLFDPLDLDLVVSWSIPDTSRRGQTILHGSRLSPEFSVVEDVRRQVDLAISRGDKSTRDMFEETGRLRRLLVDSVLNGVLAREDDPISIRVRVEGARKGVVPLTDGRQIAMRFHLTNRSPVLSARWLLHLPRPMGTGTSDSLPQARFLGKLDHQGTLIPGVSVDVKTSIWVDAPGMLSLGGWELVVETGEQREGTTWEPRRNWRRISEAGWIRVVDR